MKIFDIEKKAIVLLVIIVAVILGGVAYLYFSKTNIIRLFYLPQVTEIRSTPRPQPEKEKVENPPADGLKEE